MEHQVVTFGEIMMRLTPPDYQRFTQAEKFEVTYGGGEANVAVSLANYGINSSFVTRLPDHQIGYAARNHLRRFGVNTGDILFGGERLGLYYHEKGASQRSSVVIYDRAHSAIADVDAGIFDWAKIFYGKNWFHFTGITPALGPGPARATLEAAAAARAAGLTVSCDLNYRKKLWTPAEAAATMTQLMDNVDVVIANEEDAEQVFGIKAENSDINQGKISDKGYEQVMRELQKRFNLQAVAVTLRKSYSASSNGWSAMLLSRDQLVKSKEYTINVIDRVGGGDSFCGGLIFALLEQKDLQKALEFAVAASCLKHTIPGDFNHVSRSEVEKLIAGDGSGRVQR